MDCVSSFEVMVLLLYSFKYVGVLEGLEDLLKEGIDAGGSFIGF